MYSNLYLIVCIVYIVYRFPLKNYVIALWVFTHTLHSQIIAKALRLHHQKQVVYAVA